ncbi:unnamed protein product [Pleuronectes platessa]|uniref:[histone H3]-lysine(4) N-trimethyltransferase n=1 Tax=Pleuronectes platessa TaxID=8262 RepID=A0A9N7VB03_PLEPL|nr:unnamed protein product [Pleuronectes platessa]
MAKKSTSPFVPGVGGTHASKVMQSLSQSPSNLPAGRLLIAPSTPMATFSQAFQRQVLSVTPVHPHMIHAVASIPQHPSYRAPTDRIFYMAHTCQPACLNRVRPTKPDLHSGKNPLLMPLLYDFRRMTGRRKVNRKMSFHVIYKAPCGLCLRNMGEIQHYLFQTNCDFIFLEMFCLDPYVLVDRPFQPQRPFYYIPDITGGREDIPLSCVNEIDSTPPPKVDYSKERIPEDGVFINASADFLVGCDCTDGCRDKSKCSCHQLTLQATGCTPGGQINTNAGFLHKRLEECLPTGIYECNKRCKCCASMCTNRLVQHGLQVRLQLFKTQNKGWGIRCLDDVAKGSFVCIYAGKILTDDFADREGLEMGDEYFANLDHIESVENFKEGYESEAHCSDSEGSGVDVSRIKIQPSALASSNPVGPGKGESKSSAKSPSTSGESNEEEEKDSKSEDESDSSDDTFVKDNYFSSSSVWRSYTTRGQVKGNKDGSQDSKDELSASVKGTDEQQPPSMPEETGKSKVASWLTSQEATKKESGDNKSQVKAEAGKKQDVMTLSDSDDVQTISSGSEDNKEREKVTPGVVKKQVAVKSTRGIALKTGHGMMVKTGPPGGGGGSGGQAGKTGQQGPTGGGGDNSHRNTRLFFDGEESCYIIDAKLEGNLGRYLNHSCSPNLFVQNVFVDTHDLRFPWVAFFASKRIRAGTELTWDYNYEVGSVEGKVLLCCCGSTECRGRLVATKGIRVTRRDFLKVNVKSTCDDIMNYLLQRVPPPRPGLPRPRFSLYLSSQLQYGVILVYHRQCAILLEEVHTIVGQLVKHKKSKEIDIEEQNRQALLLPDALSLLEEAEGALDPLFGVMHMQEAMPSPSALMQIAEEYLRESSPELSEGSSPSPPAGAPRPRPPAAAAAAAAAQDIVICRETPTGHRSSRRSETVAEIQSRETVGQSGAERAAVNSLLLIGRGMTSSSDSITLREPNPLFIPIPEFEGVELVDHDLDTVDLLMAQADHFPEGDLETLRDEVPPGEQEREMERGGGDEEQDKDRTKETTGSTTELQPTVLSGEEPTLLPQEEPVVSEERPGPPRGHITPVSEPVLPPPPSARKRARPSLGSQSLHAREVPPPEVKRRRRRRKRQLVFFDPETQIPQEALQQQIDNPLTETRRPPRPLPSVAQSSAADLLNNPCTFLPEEVLSLWQQAANISPLSGSDLQVGERGPESTDSEKERDREMVEVSEREEERLELSPREVQRDLEEQENDISGLGTLSLEGSDQKERSREISPMHSLEKEGSIVSRSVSVLQDIPEVVDEFLERPAAESPGLLPDEDESAPVLFQSLLPPEADRPTVSIIFQKLLGIASSRKVRVKQREPYGDIWITPGPNYRDVLQTL